MQNRLNDALHQLSTEARDLYLSAKIPILTEPPSSVEFLRDFVSANRPVIMKNCLHGWSACSKWTDEYLRETLGDTCVTVTSTPNGYADAPVGDRFVLPEEKLMMFKDFLEIWRENKRENGIHYIQKQNSNFMDEFSKLVADADSHIQWASEAFGAKPDAVNFWMGNSESVTSMHKDHYENIYAVVRGSKTFILHPPTDIGLIPYKTYKLAQYKEDKVNKTFEIVDIFDGDKEMNNITENEYTIENPMLEEEHIFDTVKCDTETKIEKASNVIRNKEPIENCGFEYENISNTGEKSMETEIQNTSNLARNKDPLENYGFEEKGEKSMESRVVKKKTEENLAHQNISWIAIDPLKPDSLMHPQYSKCHRYVAKVEAGDMLYLPSLWFHHVTQSDKTIAVNFWYDMQYDIKYNYFKFAEQVSQIVQDHCKNGS